MQPNHSILFPYVETLRKHHILPPSMQRNHSLNISDHFLCKDVSFRKLLFPLLGSCCVSSLSEQKAAVCPLHTVHGGRRRARRHQHSQPQTVAWHNSDSLRWAYCFYVDVCQHLSCMCKYLCVCVLTVPPALTFSDCVQVRRCAANRTRPSIFKSKWVLRGPAACQLQEVQDKTTLNIISYLLFEALWTWWEDW